MATATGMTIRLDVEELQEVRSALQSRRDQLEKVRKGLDSAGLSTFTADAAIEVLDRCKVAIGDEPADMFSAPPGVDPETGEIKDEDEF